MSTTTAKKKFSIYSRKSKFTGKGDSVENQIKTCRDYIRFKFPDVIDKDIIVFEDEGFSGGNVNRPQFQRMMDACKRGEIETVVCYRLDRISRKTLDFLKMSEDFERLGVSFVSVRDNFDTSTPTGRAMMLMTSVFSQLERETIAERIRDNMHELAKTGRWLGGNTPTGYRSQAVSKVEFDGKTRTMYKLDIVPAEIQMVKMIFEKFWEQNSLSAVESYLLENHIKTKQGKTFTRFSIKNILENPVYMIADSTAWKFFQDLELDVYAEESDFDGKHGVIAYNKTKQIPGKATQTLSMSEWIIAVGRHEGIISGADWVKTQKMLEQNKSKSFHKPKSNVALLSGLLYCGDCGAFMRPKLSQRKNDKGELIYAYLCEKKERSHGKLCDMTRPNGNSLDQLVCEEVKKLAGDTSAFVREIEKHKKQVVSHSTDFSDEKASLQKGIAEIEKQIKTLISAMAGSEDSTSHGYIKQQIEELHQSRSHAENRIAEIESITRTYLYPDEEVEILRDMLSSFAKSFETWTVEEKRACLRSLIQRIEFHQDGDVRIYFFCYDGFDVPGSNGGKEIDEPKGGGCKCYADTKVTFDRRNHKRLRLHIPETPI